MVYVAFRCVREVRGEGLPGEGFALLPRDTLPRHSRSFGRESVAGFVLVGRRGATQNFRAFRCAGCEDIVRTGLLLASLGFCP